MSIPTEPTTPPAERHGCLTAWLVFMIITNAATAAITLIAFLSMIGRQVAGLQPSTIAFGVLVVCAVANIIFAFALLHWRRWGFYGFIVMSAAALIINVSVGIGIGQALFWLTGSLILFCVLHIGGDRKAWPCLK